MTGAAQPIRVLLVDDHALFRESVARVLAAQDDFRIEHCASLREDRRGRLRGQAV